MKNSKSKMKSSTELKRMLVNKKRREAARLKKANADFAKLTPAQKRVKIAEDVLAQMEVGYLKPEEGVWADFDKEMPNNDPELEFQDFLNAQKSCNVCGLGSLFVCAVKRFDNLKVSEVIESTKNDIHKGLLVGSLIIDAAGVSITLSYLKKFFSIGQLKKIESAFEEGLGNFGGGSQEELDGANFFVDLKTQIRKLNLANEYQYAELNVSKLELTAHTKMKLIMQNVVKNNGTFKTDKKNRPVIKLSIGLPEL